jgi:hypothetical protein
MTISRPRQRLIVAVAALATLTAASIAAVVIHPSAPLAYAGSVTADKAGTVMVTDFTDREAGDWSNGFAVGSFHGEELFATTAPIGPAEVQVTVAGQTDTTGTDVHVLGCMWTGYVPSAYSRMGIMLFTAPVSVPILRVGADAGSGSSDWLLVDDYKATSATDVVVQAADTKAVKLTGPKQYSWTGDYSWGDSHPYMVPGGAIVDANGFVQAIGYATSDTRPTIGGPFSGVSHAASADEIKRAISLARAGKLSRC